MNTEKLAGLEIKRTDMHIRRYFEEKRGGEGEERPGPAPTHNHRRIIDFLFENRERQIFQKDIEEHFDISPATCSKTLKLIERDGFIERRSVERDARLKEIVLTEKAFEIRDKIKKDIEGFEKKLVEGISREELDVFYSVLDKINANIEKGRKK